MKRLIELLVIVCIAVCWTGCGEDEKDPAGEQEPAGGQDTTGNQEPGNKEDCITFVTQKDRLKFSITFPRPGKVTIEWGDGNVTVYKGTNASSYGKIPSYREDLEFTYSKPESVEHTVKIKGALLKMSCSGNAMTSLVVAGNPSLFTLWCEDNKLTSLDVSDCDSLGNLSCNNNSLTSLNVNKNRKIKYLNCSNNQLTSLEVRNNHLLEALDLGDNNLSALDIRENKLLRNLDCRKTLFDAAAMNQIYTDLSLGGERVGEDGNIFMTTIYVTSLAVGNPTIATDKGWVVKE